MKKILESLYFALAKLFCGCYNTNGMRTKPKSIEEQLRQAILSCGISRYRLSKVANVSEAVLSLFVNRKRSMTLTTAAKVAKVLGLKLKSDKKKGG